MDRCVHSGDWRVLNLASIFWEPEDLIPSRNVEPSTCNCTRSPPGDVGTKTLSFLNRWSSLIYQNTIIAPLLSEMLPAVKDPRSSAPTKMIQADSGIVNML